MRKNKRIFLSPPHMGGEEINFIREAFESNYIAPLGPMIDEFEKEFAQTVGVNFALAVTSGTAAIHLALRLCGVGPGDEVIASTLTFIGGVSPIVFLGANPVFIDSDPNTWCMDPVLLDSELKRCAGRHKLPKAVVPTDLYGQCANYPEIYACCAKYGVAVIIDAAEALGSTYSGKSAGVGAEAAIFSFNGNKIITTSGGGMLVSDDKTFIDRARYLSQQARSHKPHYEHTEIGYNYRMSNILAAIGRGQLRVLKQRVAKKREIFNYYVKKLNDLPGVFFIPEARNVRSNRWLTVILITPEAFGATRDDVMIALEDENIESRPVWKPMHLQPVFNHTDPGPIPSVSARQQQKSFPIEPRAAGGAVAEDIFRRGLCLPSGTALTKQDLDRIVSIIIACRK